VAAGADRVEGVAEGAACVAVTSATGLVVAAGDVACASEQATASTSDAAIRAAVVVLRMSPPRRIRPG
jgi:hypothetical protein